MQLVALFSLISLSLFTLAIPKSRERALRRSLNDWAIDIGSLVANFILMPVLKIFITVQVLSIVIPSLKGIWQSSVLLSFVLYLLVDYAWYWNHRLFHEKSWLWPIHRTHHSAVIVDVFTTQRNSILNNVTRVHFWMTGLFTYLLNDPTHLLGFTALGVCVVYWTHTSFCLPFDSLFDRLLSFIFVSPREHLRHHGLEITAGNYGGVFSFWDRLHGTYVRKKEVLGVFGGPKALPAWKEFFWPFENTSHQERQKQNV